MFRRSREDWIKGTKHRGRTRRLGHHRADRAPTKPNRLPAVLLAAIAVTLAFVAIVQFVPSFVSTRPAAGRSTDRTSVERVQRVRFKVPEISALADVASRIQPAGLPALAAGRSWHSRPMPEQPLVQTHAPKADEPAPAVTAQRAVVIDATTGAVLWGKNEHDAASVASTIKILTALTALRFANEDEIVHVDEEATSVGERTIYLTPGEQWTVHNLLAATLVGSANDAATALGKFAGGSMTGFGTVATWLADYLGAHDTHVVNPHGLDADGQRSTAYDLAILARAALADHLLRELVGTSEMAFDWPDHDYKRVAHNRNKLLENYEGAIGVKTGGTSKAGNCLVGAAERNGQTFIAAALSSQNPTADDTALLDWAFRNYTTLKVMTAGKALAGSRNPATSSLFVTVPTSDVNRVSLDIKANKASATLDGITLATVDAA